MHDLYDVIKKPIVTEKGSALKAEGGKVVFAVDRRAKKPDIKNAVEKHDQFFHQRATPPASWPVRQPV